MEQAIFDRGFIYGKPTAPSYNHRRVVSPQVVVERGDHREDHGGGPRRLGTAGRRHDTDPGVPVVDWQEGRQLERLVAAAAVVHGDAKVFGPQPARVHRWGGLRPGRRVLRAPLGGRGCQRRQDVPQPRLVHGLMVATDDGITTRKPGT